MTSSSPQPPVRLTIERVDVRNISRPGDLLLDLTETEDVIIEHAIAWITVRGYVELEPDLSSLLSDVGVDGWCAKINKRYSLAILATWPWCSGPHDLCTLFGMRGLSQ